MKLSFVICIISAFAIAPTKGETIQHLRLLGDGSCSPEGEKSTDCGAQPRDDRAEMCCPGLKCGGENDKYCVEDKDKDDEDKMVGTSYCTFAPDYDCFETGWPACCGTEDCPDERPGCEKIVPAGDDGTGDDSPGDDSTSPAHITTLYTLHVVVGIIAIISVSFM